MYVFTQLVEKLSHPLCTSFYKNLESPLISKDPILHPMFSIKRHF